MVRLSRLAMDWARFSISGGNVTDRVRVLLMLSIVKHDLAISTPCQRCHPERSMRIRLTNPHAQSKDPRTPARASAVSGRSPGIAGQREPSRKLQAGRDRGSPTRRKEREGWGI